MAWGAGGPEAAGVETRAGLVDVSGLDAQTQARLGQQFRCTSASNCDLRLGTSRCTRRYER